MAPRRIREKEPGVGIRLRLARVEAGFTLRQLATAVNEGVTSAYLSRVETGARYPSLELLIDLSRPLNVTALWLLTGAQGRCPCCGRE